MKLVGGVLTMHTEASDSIRVLSLGIGQAAPDAGLAAAGITNTGAEILGITALTGSAGLAAGDRVLAVAAGWAAPGTLTLPASPATGRVIEIFDDANLVTAVNTLTINGNGKNIVVAGVAAGTIVLAVGLLARKLVYTGTAWFASVL